MWRHRFAFRRSPAGGFTLLELLVSMTVLSLLLGMLLQTVVQTQGIWSRTRSRVEEFREARVAFEAITRRLSQATLNSVWDYNTHPVLATDPQPTKYVRYSDLHFVSGPAVRSDGGEGLLQNVDGACGHAVFFQAPLGYTGNQAGQSTGVTLTNLENLLNGWGYYVKYTSDLGDRPAFLKSDTLHNPERLTFSLMEFRQPAEAVPLFLEDSGAPPSPFLNQSPLTSSQIFAWFRDGQMGGVSPTPEKVDLDTGSRVLARDILALIISPRLPTDGATAACDYDIAPSYYYDSREFQLSSPVNTGTDRNGTFLPTASRHQLPPVLDVIPRGAG